MKLTFFRDFFFGGLIVGIFSLLTSIYEDKPYLFKIVTFLWGAPLIYFYLLFIVWDKGPVAVKGFLIHAILGVCVTLFSIVITLYLYNFGRLFSVIANFFILFFAILFYFKYNLFFLF